MRNITGNSPIFLPSVTRKAGAKLLIFIDTQTQSQRILTFFVVQPLFFTAVPMPFAAFPTFSSRIVRSYP